ncbi:MAG: hypothetical protein JW940_26835 [Polyangiaceae bacterium]|nr:hypothetical protein [Polyangiaceae bacterium]
MMTIEKHWSGMRTALLAAALALGCGDGAGNETTVAAAGSAGGLLRAGGGASGTAGSDAGGLAVPDAGSAGELLRAGGGASGTAGSDAGGLAVPDAGSAGELLRASGGASDGTHGDDAGSGQETRLPACDIPDSQLLPTIHSEATLLFSVAGGMPIEVGTTNDVNASSPDKWLDQTSLTLPSSGTIEVFARVAHTSCRPVLFEQVYSIEAAYPGPVGDPASTPIALDDPSIVGWAVGCESLELGENSTDPDFQDPSLALGPARRSSYDVVSMGDGGSITLRFDPPITDGPGWDFAVFENGFSSTFLELGYVEVSSDGINFARFDSAYLGTEPVAQYGNQSATLFDGLAGKYAQGYGTPFDLWLLRYRPKVQSGDIDLAHITRVRIVDIIGDGSAEDSFGNPIYDPYPGAETAGFDLDAVAVIHAAD